jgi:hypothetical protein
VKVKLREDVVLSGYATQREKIDLSADTTVGMADDDRLARFIRDTLQSAEQQLSDAKRAYANGKRSAKAGLPRDEEGRARIVCRRHAEYRAVSMDEQRRPVCYDAENPDCQGCVEDIRDGTIETW